MTDLQPVAALVPFCGKPHRLDGRAIAHRCHMLPAEAVNAAIAGDYLRAVRVFARIAAAGPLPPDAGIWRTRRR
jgi:hypothetical protein